MLLKLKMSLDKKIKYIDSEMSDYKLVKLTYDLYAKANCIMKYYGYNDDKFEADEIMYGVYLGNIDSVFDYKKLKELGITHIVSIINGFIPPYPNDFNYLVINALDNINTNLKQTFKDANEFIDEAFYSNGKILIHCQAGRSRSVTVLAAYMIRTFGITVNNCLQIIKNKRDIIEPNIYFLVQLNEYYDSVYPDYTYNV
jgi:protein-tyrosine phosphatase